MNLIITGSQDSLIRIWEPYVSKKPTNILRSHNTSIVHLIIDERDNTLISIDKSQSKKIIYKLIRFCYMLCYRYFYMVLDKFENFTKTFSYK